MFSKIEYSSIVQRFSCFFSAIILLIKNMKTSIVLFIIAALLSLTGCGLINANNPPCDLSIVKIKSIDLEGDTNGMVATALKTEMFSNGAKWSYDDKGVKIVGKVTMSSNGRTPLYLIAETERQPFAGMAQTMLLQPTGAANQLARKVVTDFCRCRAKNITVRPLRQSASEAGKLSFRKE